MKRKTRGEKEGKTKAMATPGGDARELDLACKEWILREVDEDPSSGMPTRFHHWLVERLKQPLTPTQSQTKFLAVCKEVNVHARAADEGFTFVQGERPDPQPRYEGD